MRVYKPKVSMDTSSIVKWFKVEEGSDDALKLRKWTEESSDEHHLKRDLKAHTKEKGVRILTLSEVGEMEKVTENT